MTTASMPAESPLPQTRAAEPQRAAAGSETGWLWLGLSCWVIAALVLVYFHFSHTLVKPHYQFVLLVPPLVGFLLWSRYDGGELRIGTPWPHWSAALLFPLALLAAASWLFSPWLGMAALVLLGPTASLALGGWPLLRTTWGIWLLAAFTLPLPLRVDERLIVALRDLATQLTSRILDYFGTLHMISGNVIELPEKKLFVADACSGIHSLFVLLAAAAVVAVWNARGPLATACLFVSTFGLVMLENVLRLLVVSGSIRVGYDLSVGTGHQVLGFVLFAFSLAMILSMDQWIFFMSIRRSRRASSSYSGAISPLGRRVFVGGGLVALACLPLQWTRLPAEVPNLAAGFASDLRLPELGEDALPSAFGDFRRLEYERVQRVSDDPFGQHSQTWRYSRGSTEVLFSLNYPYRGMHDACLCYRNTGWQVAEERIIGVEDHDQASVSVEPGTELSRTPALVASMSHPLEGNALLLYSMLSQRGQVGVLVDSRKLGTTADQARGRFSTHSSQLMQQWVQLQMTVLQPGTFSDDDRAMVERMFRRAQAILFDRCIEAW